MSLLLDFESVEAADCSIENNIGDEKDYNFRTSIALVCVQ